MIKKHISAMICIVLLLLTVIFLLPEKDGNVDKAKIPHSNRVSDQSEPDNSEKKLPEKKPQENKVEPISISQKLSIREIVDFYASQDETIRSKSYLTIAHRFLDISENKVADNLYEFLDKVVIGETKVQLEIRSEYYQKFLRGNFSSKEDEIATATAILKTMDQLFRKEAIDKEDTGKLIDPDLIAPEIIDKDSKNIGFTYKQNLFYDRGLLTKQIDCDNMVVNYLAVADVMRLPLFYVPAIKHAYIAWELSDGTYLCFETTNGHVYSEKGYVKTEYHRELKAKGYFFSPLSKEHTIAEAYKIRAYGYLKEKNFLNSVRDFCKAIQINPNDILAFVGAATAFGELSYYDEAQMFYEQAQEMGLDLIEKADAQR